MIVYFIEIEAGCNLLYLSSAKLAENGAVLINPGYGDCPLLPSKNHKQFDETFFLEYILQQSDDEVFFDTHASGYTLVHRLPESFKTYYELRGIYVPANASAVATVWFSNQAIHTSAAALNAFSNFAMRFTLWQALGGSNITKENNGRVNMQETVVINHPLPKTADSQVYTLLWAFV